MSAVVEQQFFMENYNPVGAICNVSIICFCHYSKTLDIVHIIITFQRRNIFLKVVSRKFCKTDLSPYRIILIILSAVYAEFNFHTVLFEPIGAFLMIFLYSACDSYGNAIKDSFGVRPK
jgi:hypothetical protein